MYIALGLGNPGNEYRNTRHNTGRMAVDYISTLNDKNLKFVTIDTFMNKSGPAVAKFVKSKKAAEKLIVVYDDIDLPIGTFRISYDRGSGGHRGVESIIKALGTKAFIRIRIGISPVSPGGILKKPKGEKDVEKHILGEFKRSETEILKKVFKHVGEAVDMIAKDGLEAAMTKFNS